MTGCTLPTCLSLMSASRWMLGVRRAGVTDAVHALAGRGLIKAVRGNIQIIDRDGLAENANGCYGEPEREDQRLIGRGQHGLWGALGFLIIKKVNHPI